MSVMIFVNPDGDLSIAETEGPGFQVIFAVVESVLGPLEVTVSSAAGSLYGQMPAEAVARVRAALKEAL